MYSTFLIFFYLNSQRCFEYAAIFLVCLWMMTKGKRLELLSARHGRRMEYWAGDSPIQIHFKKMRYPEELLLVGGVYSAYPPMSA